MWVWISNSKWTVRVDFYCGKAVKAAPIAKWMIGLRKRYLKRYCLQREWKWVEFNEKES